MDAAGKDDVLIETVGVGQAEIDIVDHADTIVLALMPGSGDSIQALKAGAMEIPDMIVVNKADHLMTDTMVREVRGALPSPTTPGLAGADPAHRGGARRGSRGAATQIHKHARHRELGRWQSAAPQPAQRGPRHRHFADAPPPRSGRSPRTRGRPSCWTGWCGASSTPPPPPASCWRSTSMPEESKGEARGRGDGYGVGAEDRRAGRRLDRPDPGRLRRRRQRRTRLAGRAARPPPSRPRRRPARLPTAPVPGPLRRLGRPGGGTRSAAPRSSTRPARCAASTS